jgi:hypothetical protein
MSRLIGGDQTSLRTRCWLCAVSILVSTEALGSAGAHELEDIGLDKIEENFYRVCFCSLEVGEFVVNDLRLR